jgi:plastocyanin
MRRTVGFRLLTGVGTLAAILCVAPTSGVAGGGCHADSQPAEVAAPGGVTVRLEGCAFQPFILHVDADTDVTFVNGDAVPHAVTGAGWGDATTIETGASVSHRFSQPGIHPFQCYLHPGMVGAIVVEDESLAATSVEPSAVAAPAEADARAGVG